MIYNLLFSTSAKTSFFSGLHFLILILSTCSLSAQNQISGRVMDDKKQPIVGTTLLVYTSGDNKMVKGGITDIEGIFKIDNIPLAEYYVNVIMVGYDSFRTQSFKLEKGVEKKDLGTLMLQESSTELQSVSVTAKKNLFEQKIDRLVINVAASITSAGSTALEVLERSPGVSVDRQNNTIALSGKSGVVVMINGRISYMTNDAAIQMLNGMSANSIEQIEILSTPPANLDAEGNAGYINIVMKKNENEGLNGSYAVSVGYGKGSLGSASVNANYRKGKWNLFGDYSYSYQGQQQEFSSYRSIELNGQQVETNSVFYRQPDARNQTLRLGVNYEIDKKTNVSGLISGYNRSYFTDYPSQSTVTTNSRLDTIINSKIHEEHLTQHLGGNIDILHSFRENESLEFSADYLYYYDEDPISYVNTWSKPDNTVFLQQSLRTFKTTPLHIAVAKLDYTRNLNKKIKMESGIKAVSSKFKNNITLQALTGNSWVNDPDFSAVYKLNESVMAAYTSFEIKLSTKTTAKGGLRYEYTQTNLGTDEKQNIVDRKYGEFFPSLFLSHNFSEKSSLGLSYSRRITRPTFWQLAPFLIFVDPNSLISGNAALQSAISNTVKADYKIKSTLFTLQYSHEDSTIGNFQIQIQPGTNKAISIARNLKSQNTLSLSIGQSYSPIIWWNMYTNIGGIWKQSNGYYNGDLKSFEGYWMTINTTQSFSLPLQLSFEITGNYNSGGYWGIDKLQPFGAVNIALQKKFKKNGSRLSLGYDNIFNTLKYRTSLNLPDQQQYFYRSLQFTQPAVKISWSSNFGNQKMKATNKNILGSDEERKRVE